MRLYQNLLGMQIAETLISSGVGWSSLPVKLIVKKTLKKNKRGACWETAREDEQGVQGETFI
jgi:hypothetical protein